MTEEENHKSPPRPDMSSKRTVHCVDDRQFHPRIKRSKLTFCMEIEHSPESLQSEHHLEGDAPIQASSCSSRLSLLKTLVEEAANDHEITKTEPQIAQALSSLNHAFRFSHGPSALKHGPSQASQAPDTNYLSIGSQSNHSENPTLPLIQDKKLRAAVFMHPACAKLHDASYDRLEVLGDAYIELMSTKLVWRRFPGIPAGRISQIREILVKNETLAAFSEKYGFDREATVPGNYSEQPKRWIKTKGDIFEAYVAAVILSDPREGYDIVEQWLIALWSPMLDKLGHQKVELRSKEELAKKVMGKGVKLEYVNERDPIQERGGTQIFFIGVYLTGWGWGKLHLGSGQGLSKVAAGDEAARCALLNTPLISKIKTAKMKSMKGK